MEPGPYRAFRDVQHDGDVAGIQFLHSTQQKYGAQFLGKAIDLVAQAALELAPLQVGFNVGRRRRAYLEP